MRETLSLVTVSTEVCSVIPLSRDGVAPEWMLLIPRVRDDGILFTNDGRGPWTVDTSAIIEKFQNDRTGSNGGPRPLPFDENHSTESRNVSAPAFGWIDDLEDRDGEIWGHVEWNRRGRQAHEDKDYLFVSPVIYVLRGTSGEPGRVIGLKSAALTNNPNLADIAACQTPDQDHTMKLTIEALAAALGLPSTATADSVLSNVAGRLGVEANVQKIVEAINNTTALLNTIGLRPTSSQSDLVTAVNSHASVDAAQYISMDLHKKELAKARAESSSASISSVAKHAVSSGKWTPAQAKMNERAAVAMENAKAGDGLAWIEELAASSGVSKLTAGANKPKHDAALGHVTAESLKSDPTWSEIAALHGVTDFDHLAKEVNRRNDLRAKNKLAG